VLIGCAPKPKQGAAAGSSPSASPSPSVAPREGVLASLKQLSQTSYNFTFAGSGMTGAGSIDPATKSGSLTASGSAEGTPIKIAVIGIDQTVWVKYDLGVEANGMFGINPSKWMHIDVTKLDATSKSPFDTKDIDQFDLAGLFGAIVDVTRTDSKHYTGTIDFTKVTGGSAPTHDTLKKAGDKAKSVPFTATCDDQGRLLVLKVDGGSIDPELAMDLTYSDYGNGTKVTKPDAATVIEAPASTYELFKK
jgi:hypothetical protein